MPFQAGFTLPSAFFDTTSNRRPVVLDVVYKPVRTALLEQVAARIAVSASYKYTIVALFCY